MKKTKRKEIVATLRKGVKAYGEKGDPALLIAAVMLALDALQGAKTPEGVAPARKIVIDESVRSRVTETEIVVHRGAALAGLRATGIELRYLRGPLRGNDMEWLNHALCRIVPETPKE